MKNKFGTSSNFNILFLPSFLVLLTLIVFKLLYTFLNYYQNVVNTFLIINVIVFVVSLIISIILIKREYLFESYKDILKRATYIFFAVYILINTLGCYAVNKYLDKKYSKISYKVFKFCDNFRCDKYETISQDGYEIFVIKNTYFDYDNYENNLEIQTKYNSNEIVSVVATIYSRKELFSETLINDQIKDYFLNLDCVTSEEKIREAFEKRFQGSVLDESVEYKVTEIYKSDQLDKLKTEVTLNLD